MARITETEREMYYIISGSTGGISPGNLSKQMKTDLFEVRKILANSPLFTGLCYRNSRGSYCPMICRSRPHYGLENYSWFYSSADQFLKTGEPAFMEKMEDSCLNTATIIGTPRFPQKMTKMIRCSMAGMFKDLELHSGVSQMADGYKNWETAFHVNIAAPHGEIKMSCDVLLITGSAAYPITFVNAAAPSDKIISKIFEKTEFFSVILGEECPVIPCAVMVESSGTFSTVSVHNAETDSDIAIPVCSRDMMYRIITELSLFLADTK